MKHLLVVAFILLTPRLASAQDSTVPVEVVDLSVGPQSPDDRLDFELDLRPNVTPQVVGMITGGAAIVAGSISLVVGQIEANSPVPPCVGNGFDCLFHGSFRGYGATVGGTATMIVGLGMLVSSAVHFAVKKKKIRAFDKKLSLSVDPSGLRLTF